MIFPFVLAFPLADRVELLVHNLKALEFGPLHIKVNQPFFFGFKLNNQLFFFKSSSCELFVYLKAPPFQWRCRWQKCRRDAEWKRAMCFALLWESFVPPSALPFEAGRVSYRRLLDYTVDYTVYLCLYYFMHFQVLWFQSLLGEKDLHLFEPLAVNMRMCFS